MATMHGMDWFGCAGVITVLIRVTNFSFTSKQDSPLLFFEREIWNPMHCFASFLESSQTQARALQAKPKGPSN